MDRQTQTLMDAIESKLEAMVMTSPDRNTTNGKKQASRFYYLQNRAEKARYNAEQYAKNQFRINYRAKAVKRGNSRKQSLKPLIVKKWNIKRIRIQGSTIETMH